MFRNEDRNLLLRHFLRLEVLHRKRQYAGLGSRKYTNRLVEISGGTKRLEDGRDKQTTNRENMHRNQDDFSSENVFITPIKVESELTLLDDELEHVAPRHLQSCPPADINYWRYIPFLDIGLPKCWTLAARRNSLVPGTLACDTEVA